MDDGLSRAALSDDERRALDRAERAVEEQVGIGYPTEWLRPVHGSVSVKLAHIIEVAVLAALRGDE